MIAEATLQNRMNNAFERYDLSVEEVNDFLKKEYQDKFSKEYLVAGAILTCTNCTNEEIEVEAAGKKLPHFAKINTSIDTDLIDKCESSKGAGSLIAK